MPTNLDDLIVYTIGHSTRPFGEFVSILQTAGVRQLADVRTIPKSRRHPHFAAEALARSLPAAQIVYRHFAALGGLRKPRADSGNAAWRNDGFRGYADYMETPPFAVALDDLITFARAAPTAVMCAEAVWWRCHRQLISDTLVARGVEVRHITTRSPAERHTMTMFARVVEGRVSYRAAPDAMAAPGARDRPRRSPRG